MSNKTARLLRKIVKVRFSGSAATHCRFMHCKHIQTHTHISSVIFVVAIVVIKFVHNFVVTCALSATHTTSSTAWSSILLGG